MAKERNIFIDFLKGLCIIWVVLTHCLPHNIQKYVLFVIWGDMAVPLFLLIQCYHVFRTDLERKKNGTPSKSLREHYNLKKIGKRIVIPFIIVTLITGAVLVMMGHNPFEVLKASIITGGIGPGSYYVWIYLEFFILLPLCLILIKKIERESVLTLLLFIIISQGLEWICMYIDIPEHIYRLLCFRYIFLIYLGYLWVSNKMSISLTSKQLVISFVSLTVLLILYYSTGSLKPFLFDSNWRCFHWICYFYVALLLPWIIQKAFWKLPLKFQTTIAEVGKCSYEIFLLQMMVFTLYPHSLFSVGNSKIDLLLFIILSLTLSILPIILYKYLKSYFLKVIQSKKTPIS